MGSLAALLVAAALAPACLTGCSSPARTQGEGDPIGGVPSDLWIEVDVSPGRTVSDRAKVEERRARFVLLPDGTLHGETDRLPPADRRPARARRLARARRPRARATTHL